MDMCPHPFLDKLQGPLVLRDREQLSVRRSQGAEPPPLRPWPARTRALGEAPAAAAPIFGRLVALVETHAMGERRAMAEALGPMAVDPTRTNEPGERLFEKKGFVGPYCWPEEDQAPSMRSEPPAA